MTPSSEPIVRTPASPGRRLPGTPNPCTAYDARARRLGLERRRRLQPGRVRQGSARRRRAWRASPPVLIGASLGGGTSLVAIGERKIDARALIRRHRAVRNRPASRASARSCSRTPTDSAHSTRSPTRSAATARTGRARAIMPACRRTSGSATTAAITGTGTRAFCRERPTCPPVMPACARNLALPTLLVRGGSSDVVSEAGYASFRTLPARRIRERRRSRTHGRRRPQRRVRQRCRPVSLTSRRHVSRPVCRRRACGSPGVGARRPARANRPAQIGGVSGDAEK